MKRDKRVWLGYLLQIGALLVCMTVLLFTVVVLNVWGEFVNKPVFPGIEPGWLEFPVLLLLVYGAMTVHAIIHEAGHLLCGLLTGYTFTSFRIFNFIWIHDGQKIRLKRYSLAGTAGQCLMAPPLAENGRFSVFLYNLGGPLMNLAAGLCFGVLLPFVMGVPLIGHLVLMLFVTGIYMCLVNGIPVRTATVTNDGYNALMLAKDTQARRAFWVELKVNQLHARGVAMKDMPAEWFFLPDDAAMKNGMTAVMGVYICDRLMNAGRYTEADELTAHMLEVGSGISGIHRCQLVCNRMLMEMLGENRREVVDELYTVQQKKFMRMLKNIPDIIRTEYAYAMLCEQDEVKAAACKARFEKIAANYPYPASIQTERELLEKIDRCSEKN